MKTVYRVRDATTWHELDGEIVALETVASVYYSIAGVGATLWTTLVDGATQSQLVDMVTSTFTDVASEEATTDVRDFIASCLGSGLIEERTP